MDCKAFACKYVSTCLYAVECENGNYPRSVCLQCTCNMCMLSKRCNLKSAHQKEDKNEKTR